MVAEALVGVEAAAWLRAWAGMSMEAKEGLLDNSERKRTSLLCLLDGEQTDITIYVSQQWKIPRGDVKGSIIFTVQRTQIKRNRL